MAAGIIAKLPASWRDFATTLEHKREDISTENLIIALDVEEKARAKDAPGTSAQGASANIIVNKPTYKGKGKGKMNYGGKPKKTTNFKKKPEKDDKIRACYVCGKECHLAKNRRYRKDRDDGKPNKKVNVTIGNGDEAGGSRHGRVNFLRLDGKQICCACAWCWQGQTEAEFRKDCPFEERAACSVNK